MPFIAVLFSVVMLGAAPAAALTVHFENISQSGSGDASHYLATAIEDGDSVLFQFSNTDPGSSSIVGIYFDDGDVLDGIAGISNPAGVEFADSASPAALPLGNKVGFDSDFSAGAVAGGKPDTGVNSGESVELVLSLEDGMSFADFEAALLNGDIRVGLRVQSFDGSGPGSLVNGAVTPMPEPGATYLFVAGLAVVGLVLRRS